MSEASIKSSARVAANAERAFKTSARRTVGPGPRRNRSVLVVWIALARDIELCRHDLSELARPLHGTPFQRVALTSRLYALVVESEKPAAQVEADLEQAAKCEGIERVWVMTAGYDAVSTQPLDPLSEQIQRSYEAVRRYNNPMLNRRPTRHEIFERKGIDPGHSSDAIRGLLRKPAISVEQRIANVTLLSRVTPVTSVTDEELIAPNVENPIDIRRQSARAAADAMFRLPTNAAEDEE